MFVCVWKNKNIKYKNTGFWNQMYESGSNLKN